MFFSVVIPTCHRNDTLAACLSRLAPGTQRLDASYYEVIVTDDGSRSTAEVIVREQFPWARWFAGPRRGPAANRNAGAKHATGEWLVFTDDDCLPDAGWLAAYADTAKGPARVLEGRTTCEAGVRSPREQAPLNLTGGYLWTCNLAITRTAFDGLGGFDEAFPHAHMEDTDFRQRVRRADVPCVFVPAATVDHPPRRLPWGARRAKFHECDVIYQYKWTGRCPGRGQHLWQEAKNRLRAVRDSPWGLASVTALASAAVELWVVGRNYRGWVQRHGPGGKGGRS